MEEICFSDNFHLQPKKVTFVLGAKVFLVSLKHSLTLERPTKICIIVDQPGLVGPLCTFLANNLFCD